MSQTAGLEGMDLKDGAVALENHFPEVLSPKQTTTTR